jgi:hypothetical protein
VNIFLKDIFDNDFTVGDRVAITTSTGHRVGRVIAIKDVGTILQGETYTVVIDLSEHHALKGRGTMYAKRKGYRHEGWNKNYFMKL